MDEGNFPPNDPLGRLGECATKTTPIPPDAESERTVTSQGEDWLMTRLSVYISAAFIAASSSAMLAGSTAPALAACKPGTPNCIKQGNGLGHFGNTVGNAGDCVGSDNDTCGLKTHAYAAHSPTKPGGSQPTSGGNHK